MMGRSFNGHWPSGRNSDHDDATERFSRLVDALSSGEQPRPDDAAWFVAGGHAYLSTSAGLEDALGLRRGDRKKRRMAQRDHWLRQAAKTFDPDAEMNISNRAHALHLQVERFRSRVWPQWRDLDEPAENASALWVALFHAFRAMDGDVPKERRLIKVLGGS